MAHGNPPNTQKTKRFHSLSVADDEILQRRFKLYIEEYCFPDKDIYTRSKPQTQSKEQPAAVLPN